MRDAYSYPSLSQQRLALLTQFKHPFTQPTTVLMSRFQSIRSKKKEEADERSTTSMEDTSSLSSDMSHTRKPSSKMKEMSTKAAKGVKRQLRRLDDFLHHVTHTKHESTDDRTLSLVSAPFETARRRTVSVPSPPINVAFERLRTRSTWTTAKYAKEADRASSASEASEIGIQTDVIVEMAAHPEEDPLPAETVYVEAEVPDPFLADEEVDAQEEDGELTPSATVPLDLPSSPVAAVPDLNKEVPPPPPEAGEEEEAEEGEEEAPEIYLPALTLPAMFLPIPNTDPLTTLLNKYIYPPERRPHRDLSGEWTQTDFHTLVMTNSWRALANMARERLVSADPSDLNLALGLWHLRLSCLARLRLFNQTSAECTNLFSVLNGITPPETRTHFFDRILPFELEVMHARLKYWAGDHMGYLDALAALLKKCRLQCRSASKAVKEGTLSDETIVPMWKERGARVTLILASQMMEMKELSAAVKLLESLASQTETSAALISSIARIYLQGGYLPAAKRHFDIVEADPNSDGHLNKMNKALLAAAEGEWTSATDSLREILEEDAENYVALNNLSVVLLTQGKPKEAIDVLEKGLQASPASFAVTEPLLFNLSTLYELRSAVGLEQKKELVITVAKWGGDGLRTSCLKMPLL